MNATRAPNMCPDSEEVPSPIFPAELYTDRLVLRWAVISDAREIFERYAGDPLVTRYLSWRPHTTLTETQAFLERSIAERQDGTSFNWAIRSRERNVVLGSISLGLRDHIAQLGYCFARDAWGRGIATECAAAIVPVALSADTIERVQAYCDAENRSSARVLEKAGLTLEGTLRRYLVMPNLGEAPRDVFCYAKVRE